MFKILIIIIILLFINKIESKKVVVDISGSYGGIGDEYINNKYYDNNNNDYINNENNFYINKKNKQCNDNLSTTTTTTTTTTTSSFIKFTKFFKNENCQFKKDKDEIKKSFDQLFKKYILFQEESVKEIETVVYRKYSKPETKTVLHFFGDHGVGKTLSSKLISRVLFESGGVLEGDGLFIIKGEEYRIIENYNLKLEKLNNNDQQQQQQQQEQQKQLNELHNKVQIYRNNLYNSILNQLFKCPYSVIVLDEIQKIHPDIISILEPFFDGEELVLYDQLPTTIISKDDITTTSKDDLTDNSKYLKNQMNTHKIKTSLATFILTSDFEKEGVTHKHTIEEIKEELSKLFKSIYGDSKFSKLITDPIPFLPITKEIANKAIIHQISTLFCDEEKLDNLVIFNKDIVLSILVQKMNSLYQHENFRAIEKVLNKFIFDKVSTFLIRDYENHLENFLKLNNNNNNNNKEENNWFKNLYLNNFKNNNINNNNILFTLYIKPNQLNNNLIIEIIPSINKE